MLLVFLGLISLAAPLPGLAQGSTPLPSAPAQKTQEQVSRATSKTLEVAFEGRWRNEFRDNADLRPTDDFDHLLGQRVRLNLTLRPHPHLTLFFQLQDVWVVDAASDKVIHDLDTNIHQLYFHWRPAGSERWAFRVGRQELAYGEERLVGTFGWDNVGRSFDAALLRHRAGAWTNDFFWARQVDARRNGAPRRAGHLELAGGYLTRQAKDSPGRLELYGLFLRDGLRTGGELTGIPESIRILTLGLRRVHQPKTGWRYSLEHAWQFGARGPDDHRAAMLVATVGHAWGGRWQPRLGLEYDFATGDNNPADARSREFHNLFPTNHIFYGYADLFGLRNLHAFRLTAATALHTKLTAEIDYHRFLLAARRGRWKDAAGRVLGFDPTGRSGRDAGQELDFTARLPLHKHLSFLVGYSLFLPGAFAERTRGPETHHFGYVQTTVRF